jgi:hypothetical protein
MFGALFPGYPLITDFVQVQGGKFLLQVPDATSITEFGMTLLRPELLSPDQVVAVYFSAVSDGQWQFIGSLSASNPSQVFLAPWSYKPAYAGIRPLTIQLGLALEPRPVVDNLVPMVRHQEAMGVNELATALAQDMFNFLSSFDPSSEGDTDMLPEVTRDNYVIPKNALHKWFDRLSNKFAKDPTFIQRSLGKGRVQE